MLSITSPTDIKPDTRGIYIIISSVFHNFRLVYLLSIYQLATQLDLLPFLVTGVFKGSKDGEDVWMGTESGGYLDAKYVICFFSISIWTFITVLDKNLS